MEVLAARLKWLREKKRLGQKEVAGQIGITLSGYQKLEYGETNPKLEVLIKLCDVFDVSADFLLGRDSDNSEAKNKRSKTKAILDSMTEDKLRLNILHKNVEVQRVEMLKLAKEEGFTSKRVIEISEKLDSYLTEIGMIQTRLDYLDGEFRGSIFGYINFLLNIPESRLHNDPFLERYMPADINIQMTLFDEYSLMLYSKELGLLGEIAVYKDEQEAFKASQDILKRLNGY